MADPTRLEKNSPLPAEKLPKTGSPTRILPGLSILAILLAYRGLLDNQFVEWDDSTHVLGNYHIRHLDFSSLEWLFTNFYVGNYIPLTWLSLALDFQVGRLEPWVYHLDNLFLHCLNTTLVFFISLRLLEFLQKKSATQQDPRWPLWAAFGTALLFGLHPLHVESVAWASERKDLLCGAFYLSSLWVYLDYVKKPLPQKFWTSLGLFVAALLSKPMAVSLPLVLLLLDLWPLDRFRSGAREVLKEKIPFLIVALAASGLVVLSQFQIGAAPSLQQFPLFARLMNAGHSVIFYLGNMIFPFKLAAYYPVRPDELFSLKYAFSVFLVLAISFLTLLYRQKAPYLPAAWFFYLVVLTPVLGIVQVGNQGAADRFTYLPSLGPFLLVAAVLARLLAHRPRVLLVLAILGTALLSHGTYRQVFHWKDSPALWENVFRCYPKNNYIAYHNLGSAYEKAGRLNDALYNYSVAIQTNPYNLPSYWGKSNVLAAQGLLDESTEEFKVALQMNPGFPPLHCDLSAVYLKRGMGKEALAEAQKAVQLNPLYPAALIQLGLVYLNQARADEAAAAFGQARALDPDDAVATRNLIKALRRTGNHRATLSLYREISNHPRSLLAHNF